jgi:hypothetical protein
VIPPDDLPDARRRLQTKVLDMLRPADLAFAETGDVMEALAWVATAAKAGAPLPPRIGRWLHKAINDYRAGTASSLDAALGLKAGGKASPRRRLADKSAREGALARMAVLHTLGATIQQAAVLVARMSPEFAASTLLDRYKRSGHGRRALADRRGLAWSIAQVRLILSEYPDAPAEAAQAKAAILQVYANL